VSLRPVTIEQFPGLDLRADPGDSRGAIDLSNVVIDPARIRTRDGSSTLLTLPANPDGIVHMSEYFLTGASAIPTMIVSTTVSGTLVAITANGASVTNGIGGGTTSGFSSVAIGTPTATQCYVAAGFVLWLFNGTTWTNVSPGSGLGIGPVSNVLALYPVDNRLVNSDQSTVYFSDPGAPSTYTGSNYVQVTPGDGEAIQGAATFNNQVFVFKTTKFFVFYGTSTSTTGTPIFNYRMVDAGIGVHGGAASSSSHPGHVVAGDDGVYFLSPRGIYRTTGGAPVCVSQKLQPFFDGVTLPFWSGGVWNPVTDSCKLMWVNGRLYFSTGSAAGNGIFVWDRDLDTWSWFNLAVGGLGSLPRSNTSTQIQLAYGFFNQRFVRVMGTGLTDDAGTAIVSRYRLPFETYGTPGEKRIRETILEGTGTPTVQWSRDWGSLTTGSAVTLGTSPAVAVGRQRLAIRGRAFSLQLGAASGAWAVNRVQPNIGEGVRGVEVTV
jgi:hypothetical protein